MAAGPTRVLATSPEQARRPGVIPSPMPVECENQGGVGVTARDQHVSDGVGAELVYTDINGLQQEELSVPRMSRYTI